MFVNLPTLLNAYQQGNITQSELLVNAQQLQWGRRIVDAHTGDEWFSNENTCELIDLFFHDGVISNDVRSSLLQLVT